MPKLINKDHSSINNKNQKLNIMELFFYIFLIIFLLLLVYGFYNSIYFDIPRENVIGKACKGCIRVYRT